MSERIKKVLVTGGAGFIGSHLCEKLLLKGLKVHVVDDLSTGVYENLCECFSNPEFSFEKGSILDDAAMEKMISDSDIVFHLAAAVGVKLIINDPVSVIETNVEGTGKVLKYASKYEKKTIITSTSEVYGKNNVPPFKETDDIVIGSTDKQRWSYACSKAMDEFIAFAYHKEYGFPFVVVRLFNTVGVRQVGKYGMVLPTFVSQAMSGKPVTVFGTGEQTRCFLDVRDAVEALTDIMNVEEAIGNIINIGSSDEISMNELAEKVIAITGSSSEIQHVPYEKAYEPGFEDMKRRIPDISKIKKLIGFDKTISLENTILSMVREDA